jgi:purine nucleosidase
MARTASTVVSALPGESAGARDSSAMTASFPKVSEARRERLLEPPQGPVRVVIDTDAANEIDDQFALAWALLSRDRLEIEGVYAEPYSFGIHREDLLRAERIRRQGRPLPADLSRFESWLAGLEAAGKDVAEVRFTDPDVGMELSFQEILRVHELMGLDGAKWTFRGSSAYLSSLAKPVESEAVDHLIERALAPSDRPLHVIAIGCATNVASALLKEPSIIDRIVVTWTSGYPTETSIANDSFNLEQDILSSQLLFSSGVPLVYLPGYHVGAQLRLSLPEVAEWVRGRGPIGDYLHHLYTHNPIHEQRGITGHTGRSWVIWDLINIAWLLCPAWVPSRLVPAPRLGVDRYWHRDEAPGHLIREAYEVDRDAIFRDLFGKLEAAAKPAIAP